MLTKYTPDFQVYNPTEDTYISGWTLSNTDNYYAVCIMLPPAYPDAAPSTYVTSPSPLYGYRNRRTIASYGDSHAMHTWKSDQPGWTKLCIIRPEDWSAHYSILKVITKARLWIAAYECHLDDGKDIASFLI